MDPSTVLCATETCPDKGRVGAGNSGIHRQKTRRYRCKTCGDTFSATTGTPYDRLHQDAWLMTVVLILLTHGCPPQAIVAACGLDERTVRAWLHRAGAHCAAVPGHLVEAGQVEGGQVQADEIRVKVRGGVVWQAMAVDVFSRLWLGGVVSRTRDGVLVTRLLERVRACVATRAILLCVDGFVAYVGAARSVFREPVYTRKRGRPRLVLPDGFLLAQVVKSRTGRRLAEVTRRVVVGTPEAVARVIAATRGGTQINTAYIETTERDLPRAPGPLDPTGTRDRAGAGPGGERPVARRLRLHRLLDSREPAPARQRWPQVAGAHTGHGGGTDRPCVDARRGAALPRPAPRAHAHLETTARPPTRSWPSPPLHRTPCAPTDGEGRMTTLPWGGTGVHQSKSLF